MNKFNIADLKPVQIASWTSNIRFNHVMSSNIISVIDINGEFIADEGAVAIVESLFNNSLVYLKLCGNEIGAEGAVAIGKMLQNNTSLKTLMLDDISTDSIGIIEIIDGLKQNNFLERLDLRN